MMILGIPVHEMLHEHPNDLFFLMHGHFGNKSFSQFNGLAEQLYEMGYDVVSIDAYKHGERLHAPYLLNNPVETTLAMVDVIKHTVTDIVRLYQKHYHHKNRSVSILGISMGGHIAFLLNRYLQLDFCIPIIGSPNLKLHYMIKKKPILGNRMNEIESKLNELTLQASEFHPRYALVLNGEQDDVVSFEPAKTFMAGLNSGQYSYQGYPCGHELTSKMIQDIITYVRSNQ